MPTFSKKKAQEYVKSSGGYCPACNSFDIKIGESNWEGNLVSQRITCNKCGMTSYSPGDIQHKYCGKCHKFHKG